MQGILNINKPKGMTSFDVIRKLRKILNIKKIGHAGTLDPLATGVLPIFISNATRLIQYAPKVKSYRAYARLGIETNTYDMEGEIISQIKAQYDLEKIKKILKTFEGKILQTPPIYSAISVNGKRLYEYARKNQDVQIPQKEVEIFNIDIIDFEKNTDFPLLTFDVHCASGVYIRSIIHDLGEKLKTGAVMENLTRTMSANLKIENSIKIEDITLDNIEKFLLDANILIDLPEYKINEFELNKIKMGQYLVCDKTIMEDKLIKLTFKNKLVAIGLSESNIIKPKTVIN